VAKMERLRETIPPNLKEEVQAWLQYKRGFSTSVASVQASEQAGTILTRLKAILTRLKAMRE